MQQQASHVVKHISNTLKYFSKEALEAERRLRDPVVDPETESRWRKTSVNILKDVTTKLKLPQWVLETAVVYYHRFFMSRSLHKNDRFLVVAGAVLLASKVQESPRGLDDVSHVCFEAKHANKRAAWLTPQDKSAALKEFKEGVLLAEQCILFALNFYLDVPSSLNVMRDVANELQLQPPVDAAAATAMSLSQQEAQARMKLYKSMGQFVQESWKTSLCLQHPPATLARVGLCWAAKRLQKVLSNDGALPACLETVLSRGPEWLLSKGISLALAAEVEEQVDALFNLPAPKPQQPAAAPGAAAAQQPPAEEPAAQAVAAAAGEPASSAAADTDKPSGAVSGPSTPPAQSLPSQAEGSPAEEGELADDSSARGGTAAAATSQPRGDEHMADACVATGPSQPLAAPEQARAASPQQAAQGASVLGKRARASSPGREGEGQDGSSPRAGGKSPRADLATHAGLPGADDADARSKESQNPPRVELAGPVPDVAATSAAAAHL